MGPNRLFRSGSTSRVETRAKRIYADTHWQLRDRHWDDVMERTRERYRGQARLRLRHEFEQGTYRRHVIALVVGLAFIAGSVLGFHVGQSRALPAPSSNSALYTP